MKVPGRRPDDAAAPHPSQHDPDVVTQLQETNEQLRNLLTAMFESTDAMIAVAGGDLRLIASNTMFARHFHQGADPAGTHLHDLLAQQSDDTRTEVLQTLVDAVTSGEEVRVFAQLHLHPFDRWFDVLAVPLRVQPGAMLRARDVTTLVEVARSRDSGAVVDATPTGTADVEVIMARLLDRGASEVGVAIVTVDQYGILHRALGDRAGEELGHQVVEALRRVLPPEATLLPRGDDTVYVVVDPSEVDAGGESVIDRFSALLRDAARQPVTLGGRTMRITASVGSASARSIGTVGAAVQRATAAMLEARRRGGNRTVLAADQSAESHEGTVRLWNALRTAIQFRQMETWFQPVVRLSDDRPIAVEALARWHHPGFGDVAPGEFIPLAERNSEILQIGGFVHSRSAEVMAFLRTTRSLRLGDFMVHMNASANELAWPSFATSLLERLQSHGVRPEWFSVEIGEQVLHQPDPAVRANVLTLAEAGVMVGLDDFGTGATSFASLTELPLHRIKIDRRFVSGMLEHPRTHRSVAAMITMAADLGIDTVAAGVETTEQADALRALGCRSAQGFLFAPAVPEAELVNLLGDLIAVADSRTASGGR